MKFGSYTVGGRIVSTEGQPVVTLSVTESASYTYDPNGTYAIEHAWVQFFIPEHRNAQPPIVLLHGGGMHGGMWDTTPDGREGWLQLLVKRGYEVHVIDNVERGRAGWIPNYWPGDPILRNIEDAWTLFRFGEASAFHSRRPIKNCQFPVQYLEQLNRYFCPRWISNTNAQIAAFECLLAKLGSSIVFCHSQGGEVALRAAANQPETASRIIAIEPSGFCENIANLKNIPIVLAVGDNLGVSPMWQSLSTQWKDFVDNLTGLGGKAQILDMSDRWPGTTHLPMMDLKSEEILDLLLQS